MSNKSKSVEMAPVLQSLKEYLANHYMDDLLEEIKAAMSMNLVEGLDVDCKDSEIVIDPNSTELVRAEPWRVDRTNLIADCKMRVKFGLPKDGSIPRFIIRIINFTAEITLNGGITLHPGIKDFTTYALPERNLPKLTKYLVPVLTYDEMEVLVQEMLQKYLGENAVKEDREYGANQLAKAMGLKIQSASLYRNHYTGAVLYLKEGHARVVASGAAGTGTDDEEFKEIVIPEKTILINENHLQHVDIDRDIYHECGHYEWHSMFFELQNLHASDLQMLDYQEADEASKPAEKDICWVERQASFVGIAAMFPRPVFEPMVRKYWREVANNADNLGQKLAGIICKIASDKQKPRTIIKTRMITMGNIGAKGALNYVDGHYIASFAFDTESLSPGETFVISRSQFTEMYEKDAHFREVINSHVFVYADGHVCLNQSQYVGSTKRGYLMTKWALGHVDQCCMKFKRIYHISSDHYRVGELHYDDEYNECYLMVHSLDIAGMPKDELEEKNLEYLDSLPRRPAKALSKLIKDRVKTQRGLAAASGISEAKISRMCREDDYDYSIQDVTRIIIGLQLPPLLSSMFLEMTRFTRAVMVRYYRYQCIIDCLFMEDIETVVESHRLLFDE
ncbi:MAG: hypothetical protein IJ153_00675 [Clostridia bacterium]|nr:hypothetical protein [Clostridia bacterium]